MKNIDKQGFTLIELLAVILIIGVIASIAVISVDKTLKNSKNSLSKVQIKTIEEAAEAYYIKEGMEEDIDCINVVDLINKGYIEENEVIDPKTKKPMEGSVEIIYEANQYSYKYSEDACKYSFETDSWQTIVSNIRKGNSNVYKVGDTRQVKLENNFETHTLRLANISTPDVCNEEGISQTACGFVVEFADVIDVKPMNTTMTNVGGWKDSEMRTYINDIIYNSLPNELKNNIIDTYVVSGYGQTSELTNFITIDKLYLLSSKEIWLGDFKNDTVKYVTKQLDYYRNMRVTFDNSNSAIKKLNGSVINWWLRSADSDNAHQFLNVYGNGLPDSSLADTTLGISPAFRIG